MRENSLPIVLSNLLKDSRAFDRHDERGHLSMIKACQAVGASWADLLGPLDSEIALSAELGHRDQPNITPWAIGQMALRLVVVLNPFDLGLASLLRHSAIYRDPDDGFGKWLFNRYMTVTHQSQSAALVAMAANGIQINPPTPDQIHLRRQAIINSIMRISA